MKVVINKCFGGFGLSYKAIMKYAELKNIELYAFVDSRDINGRINFHKQVKYNPKKHKNESCIYYSTTENLINDKIPNTSYFSIYDISRDDPALIKTVELLKEKANGACADLKIIEIPNNVEWEVEEYDGNEHIAEKHRTWS